MQSKCLSCVLGLCALVLGSATTSLRAAEPMLDIVYAETDDGPLLLDLYLPDTANPPLVLWIHGGAWRFGSKDEPSALPIVEQGFALASIEFRQSPVAPFPAQVHDIKAAIRFLRANAGRLGFRAERVAIWGHSSGGHLAALIGTTNDVTDLEGALGEHLDQSSAVQAIVDMAGPTDFTTILAQSTEFGVSVRKPALELLLDGDLEVPDVVARARQASPYFHVNAGDPPLLVMHGVQDPQVPINQALQLQVAYERLGLVVEHHWLVDAAHGSPDYYRGEALQKVTRFLHRHIGRESGVSD